MIGKLLKRIKNIFSVSSKNLRDKKIEKIITEKVDGLQKFLNFQANNKDYFIKALTHRSYIEIAPHLEKSNERLEFLGDSVLSIIVSHHLFNSFPDEGEGFLTKSRALMVNKEALAKAASTMHLKDFILYDGRFVNDSSQGIKTILADALEALIGALYLDQGFESAKEIVYKWIIEPNIINGELPADKNYKGKLLELAHANKMPSPVYKVVREEGPEHDKRFTVVVLIQGEKCGSGLGKSKKEAEQNAAKNAINKLLNAIQDRFPLSFCNIPS